MTLEATIATLPNRYAGPGGAIAVLRDGEVLARHTWGWADIERRIAFTPQTLFRMCSITKQFTCSLLLDLFPDPSVLDDDLRQYLPELLEKSPGVLHLAHNQSGFRDYWATAMLSGAPPEGVFTDADALRLIARTRTLHFAPGTQYSYCNQNFRLLGDLVARRSGRPYEVLLRERIFDRAGMPHAFISADTSTMPGGTEGYEGSVEHGFRRAENNIHWTGDAGLGASLDDMIAWEKYFDANRDDADAITSRIARPVAFNDGTPARYGFGLARGTLHGRAILSHGGGLRGWRSFRFYAPAERVSIVVMFNHMADPNAAAADLFAALLDHPAAAVSAVADPGWAGKYIEPETGIATRIETMPGGKLRMHYGPGPETLIATAPGDFKSGGSRLYQDTDGVRLERATDNQSTRLLPVSGDPVADIAGAFRSDELAATLDIIASGGALYGAFTGDLGTGMMHNLIAYAADIWLLPCPRALDFSPPGDWTVHVRRDGDGRVIGLEIGCWLARRIAFTRV